MFVILGIVFKVFCRRCLIVGGCTSTVSAGICLLWFWFHLSTHFNWATSRFWKQRREPAWNRYTTITKKKANKGSLFEYILVYLLNGERLTNFVLRWTEKLVTRSQELPTWFIVTVSRVNLSLNLSFKTSGFDKNFWGNNFVSSVFFFSAK